MQRVHLAKDVRRAIRASHPWVFRRALHLPRREPAAGALVVVEDRGEPLCVGYYDPESPIAVRVLSLDPAERIDRAWVRRRVAAAAAARESIVDTDALRIVHGENDYLPGLVVDRYGDAGVVAFDGAGAAALWSRFEDDIRAVARARRPEGDLVRVTEAGAAFEVDLVRGQKTGLFLDQRDNRLRVRSLAAGRTVLNLFSYTGGFTVHAALGGARRTTSVDSARPAMAALARNLALNHLDPAAHEAVVADAFSFLEEAVRRGRRWELVVCDPPAFARSERARPRALRAYRRLNRLAAAVVEPGGMLVTASCSSHVTDADLLAVVADCDRRVRVTHIGGAAADHPVAPAFPEGRYLTCLFCAVE
ncbi:MAG: class I SAM-dependent rRNA methyltransferase [Deltaproteobacteria bacterium]|nr:MAG: class I SAM-dependent rRNA methyltransferase [Deltaproteobacteria bacterium]